MKPRKERATYLFFRVTTEERKLVEQAAEIEMLLPSQSIRRVALKWAYEKIAEAQTAHA